MRKYVIIPIHMKPSPEREKNKAKQEEFLVELGSGSKMVAASSETLRLELCSRRMKLLSIPDTRNQEFGSTICVYVGIEVIRVDILISTPPPANIPIRLL